MWPSVPGQEMPAADIVQDGLGYEYCELIIIPKYNFNFQWNVIML